PDGARKSLRRRLLEGEGLGDDDDGTGCPRRELHLQIARLRYDDVVRARREVGAGAIRGGPPLPGDGAVLARARRAGPPDERLVARCPPARRGEREDQERERQSASGDRPSFEDPRFGFSPHPGGTTSTGRSSTAAGPPRRAPPTCSSASSRSYAPGASGAGSATRCARRSPAGTSRASGMRGTASPSPPPRQRATSCTV